MKKEFLIAIEPYQRNGERVYHDRNVYKLSYGNQYRYIKSSELSSLSDAVINYLKNLSINITEFTPNKTFCFHLDDFEREQISNLLEVGQKKKIQLSDELSSSIEHNHLVYAYRPLDSYIRYWENPSIDSASLYEELSQDLIETPYADAPLDYEERRGQIAFHTNHGTTHALRSNVLIYYFYALTKHFNQPPRSQLIDLTSQELSGLALAAFLFRSGRTNELGWTGDPSYSPRSAAIFSQIALELGYEENLVDTIARAFDFQTITGVTELTKPVFYTKLFHLAHTCDLIRCCSSKEYCFNLVAKELESLLPDATRVADLTENAVQFAESLCRLTGSRIDYQMNSTKAPYFGNPYLAVKCANRPAETYKTLQATLTEQLEQLTNQPLTPEIEASTSIRSLALSQN
ncbi:SidE phosphodiesterase domain-containing protein [Legionella yabuuchiae]|uniref:SidE phosphodiesterase domain-containing protein n=1 Tax=Legionella yabuuchiae TaxID=376727 RepID=UPI0010544661|nr:SidE phosphodiesterase domain-containing protein [Legionella yabuuchiae]